MRGIFEGRGGGETHPEKGTEHWRSVCEFIVTWTSDEIQSISKSVSGAVGRSFIHELTANLDSG